MSRRKRIIAWVVIAVLAILLVLAGVSRRGSRDMVTTFYGIMPPAGLPKVSM